MKIRDVLKNKRNPVETIEAQRPLSAAIQHFRNSKTRALLVVQGARLVGLLAMRDVLTQIGSRGAAALEERVADAMTRDVVTIAVDDSLAEAHGLMVSEGVNHLPVVEGGNLVGVVTPSDVLSLYVKDIDQQRELMNAYISGSVL